MNTRRQKIWLVSMLSLMVVLSAYYLFTDDMDRMNSASEANDGGMTVSENLGATYDSQFMSDEEFAVSDEEILAQVESMQASASVMNQFDSLHFNRDQELKEKYDEINRTITDSSQTVEATSQAYTELHTLEEQIEIVQSLEAQLMQDFGNAHIDEEDGKWHVRVLADQLEKSQAVSIIESVAEQLGVESRSVFVTMMN